MREKTFWRTAVVLIGVCLLLTLVHLAYSVYAYQHCSIIYFVAGELW